MINLHVVFRKGDRYFSPYLHQEVFQDWDPDEIWIFGEAKTSRERSLWDALMRRTSPSPGKMHRILTLP